MAAREHRQVRLSPEGESATREIAKAEFEGNFSAALRKLLLLGLTAWQQGHRTPDTIKKAP
jgi:hypothetical protein